MAADDLAARRVGAVPGEAGGAQCGLVEQRRLVQVQHEDGGVGGGGVQLGEGGQAALGELVGGPAADHPHPLAGRGPLGLLAEHREGPAERADAVPAQLHHVVEAAADHVQVGVVEAGDDAAAERVDDPGARADQRKDVGVLADGPDHAVADGDGGGLRAARVVGEHLGVADDQVGGLFGGAGADSGDGHGGQGWSPSGGFG